MIKIKETKSVSMIYNEEEKYVDILIKGMESGVNHIFIPMKSIFQVQRGLTSAIQKFYRKHDKDRKER